MKRRFEAKMGLGFTVVELLVVIGITSLLIATLLPSLKQSRETALKMRCQSNIRQNGMMAINFTVDNKGKFPSSFVSNAVGTQLYTYTTQPLLSYNGCPFKGKGPNDSVGWSYSILDAYRSDTVSWPNWGNWVRMDKIRKPTQSALGIECYINQTYSPIYWETNTVAEGRHNGEGLNVVFPDAHVEFLKSNIVRDGAGNYINADWRTRFPVHSIPQTVTTIPWNTTTAQPRPFCWYYNGCFWHPIGNI